MPRAQPTSAARRSAGQGDAERELVRRGHEGRVDVGEHVGAKPLPVDGDADRRLPGALGRGVEDAMARVLERHAGGAAAGERAADEAQRVRRAGGDDDPVRVGDDAARAAEVVRDLGAELPDAALVDVAEVGVRRRREGLPHRAEPELPRERGDVGLVGAQVVANLDLAVPGLRALGCGLRARDVADARIRSLPQVEVPRGGELGVRADDDAARDAEVLRERARRGQVAPGRERAGADRAPQLVLELPAHGPAVRPVDADEDAPGL